MFVKCFTGAENGSDLVLNVVLNGLASDSVEVRATKIISQNYFKLVSIQKGILNKLYSSLRSVSCVIYAVAFSNLNSLGSMSIQKS